MNMEEKKIEEKYAGLLSARMQVGLANILPPVHFNVWLPCLGRHVGHCQPRVQGAHGPQAHCARQLQEVRSPMILLADRSLLAARAARRAFAPTTSPTMGTCTFWRRASSTSRSPRSSSVSASASAFLPHNVSSGHDEIESVEFQRLSNSSTVKTFDLSFTVKGLPQPHTFTSINKSVLVAVDSPR